MPELTINALKKQDGDLLILLSDEDTQRLQKTVEAAPKLKEGEARAFTPEETQKLFLAEIARGELDTDRQIREEFPDDLIQSRWEFREADGKDQIRAVKLRRQFKEENEEFADLDEMEDTALLAEMCYEVLKPVPLWGWGTEDAPHRKMMPFLIDACYREVFPAPSEDRYRFLTGLRLPSNSST